MLIPDVDWYCANSNVFDLRASFPITPILSSMSSYETVPIRAASGAFLRARRVSKGTSGVCGWQ